MPKFKRSDIPGIVLVIAVFAFWLYMSNKYPDWKTPSGFGPEWQCNGPGGRTPAPDFCIKKVPVDPAHQTTTPN